MSNLLSRTLTGSVLSIGGLILSSFFWVSIGFLFYGLIVLVVGLLILFNKNEDSIEQIKMKGGKNEKYNSYNRK